MSDRALAARLGVAASTLSRALASGTFSGSLVRRADLLFRSTVQAGAQTATVLRLLRQIATLVLEVEHILLPADVGGGMDGE